MNLTDKITQSLEVTSGCTEPAAIALCASFSGKYLNEAPRSFHLTIDRRTYKNAFGAGIPNAGDRKGSEWALLLGFVMGCPEKRLAIFADLDTAAIRRADKLHERSLITTELLDKDGLHIGIKAIGDQYSVDAVIEVSHSHVVRVNVNGRMVIDDAKKKAHTSSKIYQLEETVYSPEQWPDMVDTLYDDEMLRDKVQQGIHHNMAAAEYGKRYVSSDLSRVDALVMGAIYARMNGDAIPVMSCAGSGNKGLTCIIPVVAYAKEHHVADQLMVKGALLSILLTVIVTSRFGEVSSVCGAQYAAGGGVIAGILYLKKRLDLFSGAYNNFISAVGGGFCDGAKGSCAMRGNVAVSTALTSIDHAENGFIVSGRDGFLGDTFKRTLDHLARYNPLIERFERETINILLNK